MIIGHPPKPTSTNAPVELKFSNKEIKGVISSTKSIGVEVDGHLNWNDKFKIVKSKIC